MGNELLKAILFETSRRIGKAATISMLNNAYIKLPDSERTKVLPMIQELISYLKETV